MPSATRLMRFAVLTIALACSLAFGQTLQDAENAYIAEEYTKSVGILKKLIAANPKDEAAFFLLGKVQYAADQIEESKKSFSAAGSINGKNPMNFVGLAMVNFKLGNRIDAKKWMDKAKELNKTKDGKVMLFMVDAYLASDNKDDLKEAEVVLYQLKALEPKNPEPYIRLGDMYLKKGVAALALTNYQEAVKLDPNFVTGWLRIGQLQVKEKKFNEGADAFKKAITLKPDFAPPYRELGELWYLAGVADASNSATHWKNATDNYQKYVQLSSNDLGARMRYASFLYLTKSYDNAITEMTSVLKDTSSKVMLRLLGYCYTEKKDAANAKKYMDQYFQQMDPAKQIATDFEYYGRIYNLMGDVPNALTNYLKAIEMDKEKLFLYKEIAEMYKNQKNVEQQLVYMGKYLQTATPGYKDLFDYGNAWYQNKNYQRADSVFAKLCEMKPTVHIGYRYRALCAAQLDPKSEQGLAKPHYEKVLELISKPEDITKYKNDYIEANQYLGAYYLLIKQDCESSKPYWNNILVQDPNHTGAKNALTTQCK